MLIQWNQSSLTRDQRIVLFHDGSMTRLLELLTGHQLRTIVLSENKIKLEEFLNPLHSNINMPIEVILRQSVLNANEDLVFARSLWPIEVYQSVMLNKSDAIGNNLKNQKLEQFREILEVKRINPIHVEQYFPEQLREKFKNKELFCRSYYIWSEKRIMTYIEEYFFNL